MAVTVRGQQTICLFGDETVGLLEAQLARLGLKIGMVVGRKIVISLGDQGGDGLCEQACRGTTSALSEVVLAKLFPGVGVAVVGQGIGQERH